MDFRNVRLSRSTLLRKRTANVVYRNDSVVVQSYLSIVAWMLLQRRHVRNTHHTRAYIERRYEIRSNCKQRKIGRRPSGGSNGVWIAHTRNEAIER